MSLLPRIKHPDKNWHGIDGRFSSHYSKRFYNDSSLARAQKVSEMQKTYYAKEQFCNEEIEKIQRNRYVLLNISQEKEKFEKIKTRVLAEKRTINKRIKQAVIKIQKHIRGYLCRKHHEAEMEELKKAKLGISVKAMNRYVGKCCIYLADNIVEASIVIQKHMRRVLAQKLLKRLKLEDKAARKITNFFKVLRNRSKFKKSLAELKTKRKLKEIKHKLRWIKFKDWWKVNRNRFAVIRRITRSRNSSIRHKSSRASRKHSMDSVVSRKSRKSILVSRTFPPTEPLSKQMTSPDGQAGQRPESDNLLEAPGLVFEKIEEAAIEESLSLTLNQFNFDQLSKQATIKRRQRESGEGHEGLEGPDGLEGQEGQEGLEDPELNEENEGLTGGDSGSDAENGSFDRSGSISECIESFISATEKDLSHKSQDKDSQSLMDEENQVKSEKPKKVEEPPEKPIPSYQKPTAAFNSWKKRPPSPEAPVKEIFPPPKHLLVWTRCRKIYKNQTQRFRPDLKYQTAAGRKRRPIWKPPLTANESPQMQKLPKIVRKVPKIPEFLEPYTFVPPSETPESAVKLNQDEDSDSYDVDSDTSYEYEAGDFRSTGLSVALPQLYSIVKSYGKNADAILK